MDLLTIEVDGSLANPLASATVVFWAVVLSALVVATIARLARRRSSGMILLVLTIALMWGTKRAQNVVGNLIAAVVLGGWVDVGFWGGPPTWIAPVVAAACGCVFRLSPWYPRNRQ